MKTKFYFIMPLFILVCIIVGVQFLQISNNQKIPSYRALPRPIAKLPLSITSSGQNTDSYIIKDVANELLLDNYFVPMATTDHLEDVVSVVMVVGYSKTGLELKDMTFEDEKKRVNQLLKEIEERELSLITLYIRGSKMLSEESKELFTQASMYSDYLIVVDSEEDYEFFQEASENNGAPITFVDNINEVSEPFVSAFR